jgi:hypothetical protein
VAVAAGTRDGDKRAFAALAAGVKAFYADAHRAAVEYRAYPASTALCARAVTFGAGASAQTTTYVFPETWHDAGRAAGLLATLARADQRLALCLDHLGGQFAAEDPRQAAIKAYYAPRPRLSTVMGLPGPWGGISLAETSVIGLNVQPVSALCAGTRDPATAAQCLDQYLTVLVHELTHKFADAVPGGGLHNAVFWVCFSDVLTRLGRAKLIGKPRSQQVQDLVAYDKNRDALALAKKYGDWQPDSQEELDAVLEAVAATKQLTRLDGLEPGGDMGRLAYNKFLRAGRAAWLRSFPTQDRLFDSTWNFAAGGYGAQAAPTASAATPYVGFRKGMLYDGARYVGNEPGTKWPAGALGAQLGYKFVGGEYVEFPDDPALAAWVAANSKPGPLTGARPGFRWANNRYEPWGDDPKLRAALARLLPLDVARLKPDSDPAWKRALL